MSRVALRCKQSQKTASHRLSGVYADGANQAQG